ncbi:MAG: hypothetical protein HQ513_07600 [Rhodospirillales bacterium]|nr:hypothetical protein [Rhodospirillales bacterium]
MDGFRVKHIGLDIDYYHPESEQLKLPQEIENLYGIDKEKAAIFTETASGLDYSSEEMLEWYFTQSRKSLAEHLPHRDSSDKQPPRMAIIFPIQFPAGSFHIMTDRGTVDIKTLRLAVEVSEK